MPKQPGTRNFTADEQYRLLASISSHLPQQEACWNAIAAAYNTSQEAQGKPRSWRSLKQKVLGLCQSTRSTQDGNFSSIEILAADLRLQVRASCKSPKRTRLVECRSCCGATSCKDPKRTEAPTKRGIRCELMFEPQRGVDNRVCTDKTASQAPGASDFVTRVPDCSGTANRTPRVPPSPVGELKHVHADVVQLIQWLRLRDQQQHAAWEEANSRERAVREHWQQQCMVERYMAQQRYKKLLHRHTTD